MDKRIPTETERRSAETDLKLRPEALVEMAKQRQECEKCVWVSVYKCGCVRVCVGGWVCVSGCVGVCVGVSVSGCGGVGVSVGVWGCDCRCE